MSGAKRITVDEGAWRRANAAAARLREVRRDLPEMLEAVRQERQAETDRAFRGVEGRQRRVEQALSGLGDKAREAERRTAKRLRQQTEKLRGELSETAGKLRAEQRDALAAQDERVRESIAQERAERRQEIQALGEDLTALRGDRARAAETARRVLADARVLLDAIRAELPHERFVPGRLDQVERRLATAEANLGDELGAESLSLVQGAYLDLAELRAELVLLDQEWQAARLAALDTLTVVAERIRFSAELPVPDENGEPIRGLTFDVDHWSGGALERLRTDVDAVAARVRPDDSPLTTEEFREIVRAEAPELERRFDDVVTAAATALLASQARVNVAEQVVEAVEHATGFAWEENAYAGDDQREAFYSKLRHLNDNEIVIEVAHEPAGGDDGAAGAISVRILSYDRDTASEEELAARAREITEGLRERGLPVGEPVADASGSPDPALSDFDGLRSRSRHDGPSRPDAR
ncbi:MULTISPECIES: hypothetical protein [Actinomadura]|uniref:Uncharacterized protein n=1 Tax=Actinomadura yumaensis TaxID=111807 RepID=A0ABW2CHS2_9ACTN|nr:hypothetical protein [Actinomadura sp. J1-007]